MRPLFPTLMLHALLLAAPLAGEALAQDKLPPMVVDCGNPFENAYGPYDYRTATAGQKNIVEQHHFTPIVEQLRGGQTGRIGQDLDYTLRAFPNHPRALTAMVRLGQRDKTSKPAGAQWPVECYLERAIQFAPDDMAVRQIRGVYNAGAKRYDEALADLQAVVDRYPDNASARYNLGLVLFETQDYERALAEAKQAYALGFPLEGLRRKLKSAGKWRE